MSSGLKADLEEYEEERLQQLLKIVKYGLCFSLGIVLGIIIGGMI